MKTKMLRRSGAVALALGMLTALAYPAAAQEKEDKKLSDRTVRVILGLALAAIPEELPGPDGKMVKIDRSDPNRFMIPLEEGRRIIVQATLSARADLCGLKELERKHFESIMRHELARNNKKGEKLWSPLQLTYIDHIIATTNSVMTGTMSAGDERKKDDGSQDVQASYTCSPDERDRAREAVEANIKQLAQAKQ
jgi:hypothetical protein